MTMTTAIATICDANYFDRAALLAQSARQFAPECEFVLVDVTVPYDGIQQDHALLEGMSVVPVRDLIRASTGTQVDGRTVVERATAVKAQVLSHLSSSHEAVVYLDPDTHLYGPIEGILEKLRFDPVVVTPHLLAPGKISESARVAEFDCLRFGTFNLGFLGLRGSKEAREFLRWLDERTVRWATESTTSGLFTDQKWLDLALAVFPFIGILRDPGYNVANWNLHERDVELKDYKLMVNKEWPLILFHFSKADSIGLEASMKSEGFNSTIASLWRDYLSRLKGMRGSLQVSSRTVTE